MKIDPNGQAFPVVVPPNAGEWTVEGVESANAESAHVIPGLTIRAYFAGLAMQGMLAGFISRSTTSSDVPLNGEAITEDAVGMADDLIAALNAAPTA